MDRDAFVNGRVLGFPLLVVGDASQSNLVKALRGESPFGQDIGVRGAPFRRMPAGRMAATDGQIDVIEQWIDEGCLDDELTEMTSHSVSSVPHVDFWRDLDDWAMYQVTVQVRNAIDFVMPAAISIWFPFAKGQGAEAAWTNKVVEPDVLDAVMLLSRLQKETVERHYGYPIDASQLFESFVGFGKGHLPPDPNRPINPKHQMNGSSMWFIWSAVADACIRLQVDAEFWNVYARGIIIGALHDGLFRRRFNVVGYSATQSDSDTIVATSGGIDSARLVDELGLKYRESGL